MYLKNNYLSSSFIFVFLFVSQQIIAFTYSTYSLVSFYWFVITVGIFYIGINLPLMSRRYRYPLILTIVSVLGAILTLVNGNTIIWVVTKSVLMVFGFIGYVYVSEKKINLILMDFMMIIAYTFFYFSFFLYDSETRLSIDGDLFGHSSSNTISMSLCIILYVYLLINKHNENANSTFKILIYAIINLVLIIIQGSRAGVVVSSMIAIIALTEVVKFQLKKFYVSLVLVLFLIGYVGYIYLNNIQFYLDSQQLSGISSYEDDIRSFLHYSFFINMDFGSFFFGYVDGYDFGHGFTRTFNSFFDFWSRYGLFPSMFFVVFLMRRALNAKDYSVPLIYFIPFVTYSWLELLWGGTLWDVLIYLALFYSYKK